MNWRHSQYINSYKLKRMYNKIKTQRTGINVNNSYEGERIEQKVNRIVNNKEPITDGAPRIYTERKDGVKPEHDIRTDRWEVAIDAMDKVSKSHIAKREDRMGKQAKEGMEKEAKTEAKTQEKPISDKPSQ